MIIGSSRLSFDVEGEGHLVRPGLLRLRHVLVIERHARIGRLVHLEAIDDVLRRDRRSVIPACFVAELEGHRREVGRIRRPFGDQAVGGRGSSRLSCHQAFVDEAETRGRPRPCRGSGSDYRRSRYRPCARHRPSARPGSHSRNAGSPPGISASPISETAWRCCGSSCARAGRATRLIRTKGRRRRRSIMAGAYA
mgnify:CR=1 FL=1